MTLHDASAPPGCNGVCVETELGEPLLDFLQFRQCRRSLPAGKLLSERSSAHDAVGEMHDRQIVATALRIAELGDPVALLTRDVNIAASGLVPVIW